MSEVVEEQTQETAPDEPDEPVEAGEPDDEPDNEPDQDGPQQTAETATGSMTMEEAESAAKQSASDWKRFRARLETRWGDEAKHLTDCPLCLDQHKGLIDVRHAGMYPDEAVRVISEYLGVVRPVELKQLPNLRTCDVCGGEGDGLTGSNNPKYRKATCPACRGFGFLPPPSTGTATNGAAAPEGITFVEEAHPVAVGDVDSFGIARLLPDGRENPNWGRMPAHWDPQYPTGPV